MSACQEDGFSIQHEQALGGPNTRECQATERLRVRKAAIRNLERHFLEKHYARAYRDYGSLQRHKQTAYGPQSDIEHPR
jgi:hypothetical protein